MFDIFAFKLLQEKEKYVKIKTCLKPFGIIVKKRK